jgi:hypothetical protein
MVSFGTGIHGKSVSCPKRETVQQVHSNFSPKKIQITNINDPKNPPQMMSSNKTSVGCALGSIVNTLRAQLIFPSKPNFRNLFDFPATQSIQKSISSTP